MTPRLGCRRKNPLGGTLPGILGEKVGGTHRDKKGDFKPGPKLDPQENWRSRVDVGIGVETVR